jgi:DNA-binding MarR family transcriptional regulator
MDIEAVQWLVLMVAQRERIVNTREVFNLLGVLPSRAEKILRTLRDGGLIETTPLGEENPIRLTTDGMALVCKINAVLDQILAGADIGSLQAFESRLAPLNALFISTTRAAQKNVPRSQDK